MPHTAIMQVWTEDIMIERIVQCTWIILGMDDSHSNYSHKNRSTEKSKAGLIVTQKVLITIKMNHIN